MVDNSKPIVLQGNTFFGVPQMFVRSALIDLDATFFVQLALFGLVYLVLYFGFFRHHVRLIRQREELTKGLQKKAQALTEEAQKIEGELEANLARAKAQALLEKRKITEEGMRLKQEIVTRERQRMQEELEKYLARLEEEKKAIMANIQSMALELSELIEEQVKSAQRGT